MWKALGVAGEQRDKDPIKMWLAMESLAVPQSREVVASAVDEVWMRAGDASVSSRPGHLAIYGCLRERRPGQRVCRPLGSRAACLRHVKVAALIPRRSVCCSKPVISLFLFRLGVLL